MRVPLLVHKVFYNQVDKFRVFATFKFFFIDSFPLPVSISTQEYCAILPSIPSKIDGRKGEIERKRERNRKGKKNAIANPRDAQFKLWKNKHWLPWICSVANSVWGLDTPFELVSPGRTSPKFKVYTNLLLYSSN